MKIDWGVVDTYVQAGLVTVRDHPYLPLHIINYTPKCQYGRAWDQFTLSARGLVVDDEGEIVARPLPKFFNVGEVEVPNLPFVAYDKLDGSLIIAFMYADELVVATRGSFESEQAALARGLIGHHSAFNRNIDWWRDGVTYLFELIHPKNRIVVDYGDREELVHLVTIETSTGKEVVEDIPFPRPEMWVPRSIGDLPERENAEGFVLKFIDGTRMKMKYDQYVEYHKVIFGLNDARTVEMLRDGLLEEYLENIPDELHGNIRDAADKAEALYDEYIQAAQRDYDEIGDTDTRKEFALRAVNSEYMDILFGMYDNAPRKISAGVWKRVMSHIKDGYFEE